jgi:hypothetical protein
MENDNEPPEGGNEDNYNRIIKKRKQYPPAVKQAIWEVLVGRKVDGELPHGTIAAVQSIFKVSRKVVMNVLERGEAGLELGLVDFTDRRVNNTKPLKYDPEVLKER